MFQRAGFREENNLAQLGHIIRTRFATNEDLPFLQLLLQSTNLSYIEGSQSVGDMGDGPASQL